MATLVRKPPLVEFFLPTCYHGDRFADYGVCHTTEGLGTVESYGRFFRNTPDKLASTFLVERTGRAGIYVDRMNRRTYHVRSHNSQCYGIEQVGFANTTRKDWLDKYRRQVYMTAWILAWAGTQFPDNIAPIAAGREGPRQFTHSEGITQHRWVPNNDHNDCGMGFPIELVIDLARKWTTSGGPTLSTRFYIATGHRPSKAQLAAAA